MKIYIFKVGERKRKKEHNNNREKLRRKKVICRGNGDGEEIGEREREKRKSTIQQNRTKRVC